MHEASIVLMTNVKSHLAELATPALKEPALRTAGLVLEQETPSPPCWKSSVLLQYRSLEVLHQVV